jgi:hypothetical protein
MPDFRFSPIDNFEVLGQQRAQLRLILLRIAEEFFLT